MLTQTVLNYEAVGAPVPLALQPAGDSAAVKEIVLHLFEDNATPRTLLDIGFGVGGLAAGIRENRNMQHWTLDGVDGWLANCQSAALIQKRLYRNVWHGLAQDLPRDALAGYDLLCLFDVLEHLTPNNAIWLVRSLLSGMRNDAYLVLSTPLWFYPQDSQQEGDLEEHLIGFPASSMMALLPVAYTVSAPLVGTFVYGKRSLDFVDFLVSTVDKSFGYERGLAVASSVGLRTDPGVVFRTGAS